MSTRRPGNTSITFPTGIRDTLRGAAFRLSADTGRQISMSELARASWVVSSRHYAELLAELTPSTQPTQPDTQEGAQE